MVWDGVPTIEFVLGKEGLYGLANRDLIPLGGATILRNVTLEDHTYRKGGGASKLGSAFDAAVTGDAAIDFWPDATTQRTLVACGDGTLRKDNGNGGGWSSLATGLTTSGRVPMWILGGAEQSGRNRKAFYCDRINPVQVLSADGATTAALASPPVDWASTNQPGFLVVHAGGAPGGQGQGSMWGGGNANDPHRLYRSLSANHEDFLTFTYTLPIFPGVGERLVAGASFKGLLIVWKYPTGVFVVDTSDPDDTKWSARQIGHAGMMGPLNWTIVENDLVWVAPDGSWHRISATDQTGSVRASDISAPKLARWMRENVNRSRLTYAQMVYHSEKLEVQLACANQGDTPKNRKMVLEVSREGDVGDRWIWWDRDRNEALYIRKKSEIAIPAFVDNAGQVWEADQATRSADGAAYTMQFEVGDNDFSQLVPGWRGRKKKLRFIQLVYDARGTATLSIEIYRDGSLKQTITFSLTGGPATLPSTLPITLSGNQMKTTARRLLQGSATRLAIRGNATGVGEDVSIARIILGLELDE